MAAKKKAVKRIAVRRASTVKKSARKTPTVKPQWVHLAPPRLGEPWPRMGGNFVGTVKGENGQLDYCLVMATHASGTLKGPYGPTERVKGAESEFDGLANTKAMAAAGSEIAKQALAVRIEHLTDFYIPSRHEARVMEMNGRALCKEGYYWTSTQHRAHSDYAWAQYFGNGNQANCHKDGELPVRLVRRVPFTHLTIR